jgi:hypothetical protein
MLATMSIVGRDDLSRDLSASVPRAVIAPTVQELLGISATRARKIVDAFDAFVALPLEANLRKLSGRDLARRNPMIYTVRGVTDIATWVDQVLADKETSAIENHIGTFLEEVARIVSGGIKPGSGVDLQVERSDLVELFAIQTAPATKNSGGRKTDVESLKRAARPLRAARRHVDLYIAVLSGRRRSAPLRAEPEITVLGSDDFWTRVSGTADFRARLLRASVALAPLVKERGADDALRIAHEARELFGDRDGRLDVDALALATLPRLRAR